MSDELLGMILQSVSETKAEAASISETCKNIDNDITEVKTILAGMQKNRLMQAWSTVYDKSPKFAMAIMLLVLSVVLHGGVGLVNYYTHADISTGALDAVESVIIDAVETELEIAE